MVWGILLFKFFLLPNMPNGKEKEKTPFLHLCTPWFFPPLTPLPMISLSSLPNHFRSGNSISVRRW